MKHFFHHNLFTRTLLAAAALLFAACSQMSEDLPPCPEGLDIYFKYDYNLQHANMFKDHVGAVTVYLFDQEGKYIQSKTVENTADESPLKQTDFKVHFDVEPGTYQYEAVAWQKPYKDCEATPGAKFRTVLPTTENFSRDALHVTLDTTPLAGADTLLVDNRQAPLDTLWLGYNEQPVETQKNRVTSDTCSLVRHTKQISVTLRNVSEAEEIDVDDYDITLTARNATVNWNHSVDSQSTPLRYTPYAAWNTPAVNPTTVHADFMTSRIVYNEDHPELNATLSIVNKTTGNETVKVDLPYMLLLLRSSLELGYSKQEFLDRGYDYRLTFFLSGGRWVTAEVSVGILDWSVRISNTDL